HHSGLDPGAGRRALPRARRRCAGGRADLRPAPGRRCRGDPCLPRGGFPRRHRLRAGADHRRGRRGHPRGPGRPAGPRARRGQPPRAQQRDRGGIAALLAGGEAQVELVAGGAPVVRVTGAAPAVPASGVAVENAGDILAAGGTILLHGALADAVLDTVVKNSGLLQADGLATNADGTISLVANGGVLVVAGTVGAGGGQVVLASSGHIDLGATLVAGALEIGADSLEQDPGGGAVTVTGTASIQAAGDATFNRGGNDFAGTVDLAVGGHALLVD